MMFGGHRPIFGCIDHRVSPTQAPFARTAPERTAWDAQRGPIKEVWEWKARTLCVGVSRRAVCTFTATKSRDRVPRRTYRARCNAGGRSHLANPPASAIAEITAIRDRRLRPRRDLTACKSRDVST